MTSGPGLHWGLDLAMFALFMITDQPGNFSYAQLLDRPFNNLGRNDLINDTPCQGGCREQVYHNWQLQGGFYGPFSAREACMSIRRQASVRLLSGEEPNGLKLVSGLHLKQRGFALRGFFLGSLSSLVKTWSMLDWKK